MKIEIDKKSGIPLYLQIKPWIKKLLSLILIVGLVIFMFSEINLVTTHITFGTGRPGGTYYPLGGAMAGLWTKLLKAEGIEVTAESTATSVEVETKL